MNIEISNNKQVAIESLPGLDARLMICRSRIYRIVGFNDEAEILKGNARAIAFQLAVSTWPDELPILFKDESELTEAFYEAKRVIEEAHSNEDAGIRRKADAEQFRRAKICQQLDLEDWAGVGLPAPANVRAALLAGESIIIEQHNLYWEDGLIWFCNPYGCDGVMGSKCDEATLASIMRLLALGQVFGLEL